MKARINEVFDSVQGEGLYLGERQVFVRFFGCNLNCRYCDTKLDRFSEYDVQELVKEIQLYLNGHHSVAFTGGEPLLQVAFLKEVMALTRKSGYKNYLETNGTLSGELKYLIDEVDIVAMDIKLPSSTDMGNLWGMHRKFLRIASEKEVFLKAIICKLTRPEDLKEGLELIKSTDRSAVLVLQPNSFEIDAELLEKVNDFKRISAQEGITTCVIQQMHKMIGVK